MLTDETFRWLQDLGLLGAGGSVTQVWRGDANVVHRIEYDERIAFLKIGPSLAAERDRLRWLSGRLPVPSVLAWQATLRAEHLVTEAIHGEDLACLARTAPAEEIVRLLALGLRRFHAAPSAGCPFVNGSGGQALVHGDACLPNLISDGATLVGYIDLGDAGLGDPETDLAAAVWSLQRNLGQGYGRRLLEAYGWRTSTDDEAERLRRRYGY